MGQDIQEWVKIFKNGPNIIPGRQPLKILLGPSLNTLTHIYNRKLNVRIYENCVFSKYNEEENINRPDTKFLVLYLSVLEMKTLKN